MSLILQASKKQTVKIHKKHNKYVDLLFQDKQLSENNKYLSFFIQYKGTLRLWTHAGDETAYSLHPLIHRSKEI